MAKVHLTSLGCPKNRVDAEHMLGMAQAGGHQIVTNIDEADTLVVNTCAFIDEAKEESIDAILRMVQEKSANGANKKLIVTGCLAQRYAKELEQEIPEVDHFFGTSDYTQVADVLGQAALTDANVADTNASRELVTLKMRPRNLVSQDLSYLEKFDLPRVNTSPSFSAYLRISEGCDNACAFCIIPKLRGAQRSRTIDDLVKEATHLARTGVSELNLIGQDLTAYGFDLPGRPALAELLSQLSQVEGIRWIRQLYAYPRSFSEQYFKVFNNKNVLPYIDMPVQHGSENVLRLMRRGGNVERLSSIINSLRQNIEGLVLRTTVMVGFPGETEDDIKALLDFVAAMRFDRMGVFQYSNEENTRAFTYDNQVPKALKAERYHRVMSLQRDISAEIQQSLVGSIQEAVVEGRDSEHEYLISGRLWSQAPGIDGKTYIASPEPLKVGQMVKLLITDAHDYDLSGEVVY